MEEFKRQPAVRRFVLNFHIFQFCKRNSAAWLHVCGEMSVSDPNTNVYTFKSRFRLLDLGWPVVFFYLFFSLASLADVFPAVASGDSSASKQGGIQAISLAVTLGIALLGGVIVGGSSVLLTWGIYNHGQRNDRPENRCFWLIDKAFFFLFFLNSGPGFILKLPIYGAPPDTICFEDNIYWEVSEKLQANFKENLWENYFPICRKLFSASIQAGHRSPVLLS